MSIKKIILGIIIVLAVSITGLFIWLILPGEENEVAQLIPSGAFAFASVKISLNNPGTADLFHNLKLAVENSDAKIKNRFLIKYVVPFFLPIRVIVCSSYNPDSESPDYLMLVKNNRLAKIARFLKLSGVKLGKGYFYTTSKETVILSNNPSLIEASVNQYQDSAALVHGELLNSFRRLENNKVAALFISNKDSYLSLYMKRLEEKVSYALSLGASAVEYINGHLALLDTDSLKGSLIFKYKEGADIDGLKEDIFFLEALLKRLCKANALQFTSEEKFGNDEINLNFIVSGVKLVITKLFLY